MIEPALENLLTDLRGLVNSARARAAASINSELKIVATVWQQRGLT